MFSACEIANHTILPHSQGSDYPFRILTCSAEFKSQLDEIEELIKNKIAKIFLIWGESGVGKELVARFIHDRYTLNGRNGQFQPQACTRSSLSPELGESILFGCVKGLHSKADTATLGLFQAAANGSLFLDEINSSRPDLQEMLLRPIETGYIRKVGGHREEKIDVTIIFGANENLLDIVGNGRMKNDFYQRISRFQYRIPPLRERPEDIHLLASHFLLKYKTDYRKPNLSGFSDSIYSKLAKLSFMDSNVRGLEDLIEYMVRYCPVGQNIIDSWPERLIVERGLDKNNQAGSPPSPEKEFCGEFTITPDEYEKAYYEHHLKLNNGNVSRTARAINKPHTTISSAVRKMRIDLQSMRKI